MRRESLEPLTGQIVKVIWLDTNVDGSWLELGEAVKLRPSLCCTIGLLLCADDICLVVASGTVKPLDAEPVNADKESCAGVWCIPLGCAVQVTRLDEPQRGAEGGGQGINSGQTNKEGSQAAQSEGAENA